MAKVDASWATVKAILGWILNTLTKTISLPAHRLERIQTILASINSGQPCVALKITKDQLEDSFRSGLS
jgi:hypothetical protein